VRNLRSLTAVLVLLAGCSTISVDTDYDKNADFAKYRTFRWISRSAMRFDGEFNQLTDQRIRAAITDVLRARGIEEQAEGAQLTVAYHTGSRERTEVYSSGWGGGGYYGGYRAGGYGAGGYGYWPGYGHSSIETRTYVEGTLMVDLIDAEAKQLVWRGKAVGVVGDYESQEARIREAVTEMFKKYPPTTK